MENFDGDKGKYSPNPNFQNRQKEGFINQQFQQSQQQQDPTYKTRLCQVYNLLYWLKTLTKKKKKKKKILKKKKKKKKTFEKNGSCPYESRCTFAHGLQELRERPVTSTQNTEIKGTDNTKLKTRLCARFMEQNFCEFGSRCTFAHGQEELRTIDNSSPQVLLKLSIFPFFFFFLFLKNHFKKKKDPKYHKSNSRFKFNFKSKSTL